MDLKIIGKVNFRNILYFGVLEVLATVLICYTLAVMEGHKPAWLPTISECGVEPPEKYIFRWGIMTGGILLFIEAIILYWSKWTSSLEYYLGMIAGLLLTGVAVVAVNENLTVHLIFALGFFGIEDIVVLLMLGNSYKSMRSRSLALKIPSAAVAVAATIARFAVEFGFMHVSADIPIVAIIEWINVAAIIVFHLTLSDELHDLYLAGLQDESAKKEKNSNLGNKTVEEDRLIKTPL